MIGELANTAGKRLAEYKLRRQRYAFQTFSKDEFEQAISDGWEHVKENKTSHRFQKLKTQEERFENEIWCLLYKLGYTHLNTGRNFDIAVSEDSDATVGKRLNVFAYDDETIIIIECQASENRVKRSLSKNIIELDTLKKPISNTLRKVLGQDFQQKIIWMIATKNIDWTDNDVVRAKSANINIITETDLLYFEEIASRIGHSARFQFQAEFLANSKALKGVDVLALRSKLGGFNTYLFFIEADKLLPISYVNHRGLRDVDAAPTYQRLVQKDRLAKIAEFIKKGGYFPNSVIVNFKKPVTFNKVRSDDSGNTTGILTLPDTYKSVWIIDGQHRLYGYAEIDPDDPDGIPLSQIPILAFENISTVEETRLFSDINSKQKTVAKKLLDEITGDMKLDSADRREQLRAIAVRALDLMRHQPDGVLYGKIAGAEIANPDAQLAIPYLADALGQSAILGRVTKQDGTNIFVPGCLFWEEPREAVTRLAVFLDAYLDIFRRANAERWELGKQGRFASNTGIAGLIRFAGDLISYLAHEEQIDPRSLHPKILAERLEVYLQPASSYFATASLIDLADRFATPFGAGGPAVFQFRLRELTHAAFPTFMPAGFEKDLREHSATRVAEADRKVRAIQESVQGHVIQLLRHAYPGDNYLEEAVDNKEMLKKTYEKYLDNDPADRKELATYLDFLDLRKIVESPKNWKLFDETFNIALPTEKKGKARYVSWFDEVNKIRRIPAHPFNRSYSDYEVSILDLVYERLRKSGVIGE